MEEREREETFRLKRFKKIKAAAKKEEHICSCCRAMLSAEETVIETVCPLCKKSERSKLKPSELELNIVPCNSEDNFKENRKRLEHLMSHIDDVIDLTKQYKIEGIISPSIDKFIRTCNQVKEKIEDYANAQPTCDLCKTALGGMGKISASRMGPSRSMKTSCSSDRPTEEPPCYDGSYNLTPEREDKLGHFEKKFKEIVKVTRFQNEDGTISEEKQVITIKTERRNPRQPKSLDRSESNEVSNFENGGGYGRNGRNSYYAGPKQAKSEHICRSQQMTEPKLRSCMSVYNPKSTSNKDVSANINDGSCFSIRNSKITLPPEGKPYNVSKECGKISQSTSLEACCPKKSTSVCGGELSQSYLQGLKKPVSNASVQACCKEIKVNKPTENKGTCCLPTCKGDKDCSDKTEKHDETLKTTSTNALWRDTWTSTSDLIITPSKVATTRSSAISNRDPNEDSEKTDILKTADSCCTIKIIMKPAKVCTFEEKLAKKKQKEKPETGNECTLRGSMFETLKRIILPSHTPMPSNLEPPRELEMKNICKNCITKLNSAVIAQKLSASTARRCQVEVPSKETVLSCPSCGTIAMSSSFDIASNKSAGVGSLTESGHTCPKSPTPSIHSQKHVCCLAKMSSEDSFVSTCCDLVESKSQKSACCAKSKSSTATCFKNASDTSGKGSSTNVCSKDAGTCTKRSTRFDVRPMRKKHTCEKISLKDCSCRSDSLMPRNRGQHYKDPRKCQSFHENDYFYFKW